MPSYKLVIVSPNDLKEERIAVEAALQRINQSYRGRVWISFTSYEADGAPQLGNAQDAAFDAIGFDDADFLIGLLWSRLGSPTGNIDPETGKEYVGGTVQELAEAARRISDPNFKLRRAMVYECTRPVDSANANEVNGRASVVEYCNKLRNEKHFDIGTFETRDGLRDRIVRDLESVLKVGAAPGPRVGANVWVCCDRSDHVALFERTLSVRPDVASAVPLSYMITGNERDRPVSLVLRLTDYLTRGSGHVSRLKPITLSAAQAEMLTPVEMGTAWTRSLIGTFDGALSARAADMSTLMNMPAFRQKGVVILDHLLRISRSSQWNATVTGALEWYLTQFWASYSSAGASRPAVILFITVACANLEIASANGASSLEMVQRDLAAIEKKECATCRRVLLPPLPFVERENVLDWFRENEIYESEDDWDDSIRANFKDPDDFGARPMEEIERALRKIHAEFVKQLLPQAS